MESITTMRFVNLGFVWCAVWIVATYCVLAVCLQSFDFSFFIIVQMSFHVDAGKHQIQRSSHSGEIRFIVV